MSKNKDTNLGKIRTRYHFSLDKLYQMADLLEQHVAEDGFERPQDNNFVAEVEAWIREVPTRCNGPELKGNCGNPQLAHENKTINTLCWECQDESWRASPPSITKSQQKTIDKMEVLWLELLIGNEGEDFREGLKVFKRSMAPLRKRIRGNDAFSFHETQLTEKYGDELDGLLEKEHQARREENGGERR